MFSNRFNTKNDPLLEAAEAAMRDGDLRRQAEGIVNEAFGVYNRKAVVNEHLADYDAAIEEVYAGLKEGVWDSIGSYLKNPTPTQKAVQGAAQGAADRATGGMLGKLGSALSVGGSSAAPSGQTKNIREGKPNDGNLANNYPPYDKVTRGDVVAGRLGKDQMGGKRKMAEGMLDPKDPSVQGSGDVTSSARTSRPPVARKAPNDPSVQGSGDVTSRGRPVSVREEEQLDELKRSTLTSYIRKAARAKATPENISKRSKGLGLAAKKLEKIDEAMSHGARELSLYADNHAGLHRSSHQPIVKNLSRKHAKGSYDHSKAEKLWGYHAKRASDAYHKEFGHKFSVADRREAAKHMADSARDEHGFGSVKEDRLDEISKRTLGSYVKKASHDVATRSAETRGAAMKADQAREKQDYMGARRHEERSNKLFNKSWKRRKGIAKAIDRLTKEDSSFNYAQEAGKSVVAEAGVDPSAWAGSTFGRFSPSFFGSQSKAQLTQQQQRGTNWSDVSARLSKTPAAPSYASQRSDSSSTPSTTMINPSNAGPRGQAFGSASFEKSKATGARTASRGTQKTSTPLPPRRPGEQGTTMIKRGDTLSALSKSSGLSVQDIMKQNPSIKDPNKIRAGSSINLQKSGTSTTPSVAKSSASSKAPVTSFATTSAVGGGKVGQTQPITNPASPSVSASIPPAGFAGSTMRSGAGAPITTTKSSEPSKPAISASIPPAGGFAGSSISPSNRGGSGGSSAGGVGGVGGASGIPNSGGPGKRGADGSAGRSLNETVQIGDTKYRII